MIDRSHEAPTANSSYDGTRLNYHYGVKLPAIVDFPLPGFSHMELSGHVFVVRSRTGMCARTYTQKGTHFPH